MASQVKLLILILIVSTILLLIGICTALPLGADVAHLPNSCDKSVPHLVIINDTTGQILNCYSCTFCQQGTGLSIPCNGQNVTTDKLDIHCKPCVSGVNYSTGESIQCQDCLTKTCKDGEMIRGKCETTGDKRECTRCEQPGHYYNKSQQMCLPCSCNNMTAEIEQICNGLGVNLKCLPTSPNNHTSGKNHTTSTPHTSNSSTLSSATLIAIVVPVFIIFLFILGVLVSCWIKKRVKNLEVNNPDLSIRSKEFFCKIFCCKGTVPGSRPPPYHSCTGQGEERPALNGNGHDYLRQNSCPVTENEKCRVKNGSHAYPMKQDKNQENVKLLVKLPDCNLKKFTFFDMNVEVCHKICQKLKDNVDTGMGYVTLAGKMGFSKNQVTSFEREGDVCEKMFRCWTDTGTENNVLKLRDLVESMQRADILELLDSELQDAKDKCGCSECVNVV